MPVDLSQMGLQGIKAGQDTLDQIANRKALAVETDINKFKLEDAQLDRALGQQAAARMAAIERGDKVPPDVFGSNGLPEDFDNRSAPFDILASVYARGGMPGKAMEFAKAASTLDKEDQEINSAQFTDTKNQLENYQTTAAVVASTFGNAKNDSEWEYAKAEIAQQPAIIKVLGEANWEAIKNMPYDPDVAALFRERAMTEYQKYSLEATANYRNRTLSNAEALRRVAERNAAVNEARAADARRAQALKDKGAKDGKSAEAPNAQQVKAASALIINEVYGGKAPKNMDTLDAGAFSIASRINSILASNPALSWDTAAQRAILESRANKEWDTVTETYSPKGQKVSTAIPVPPDPTQLKEGYYYKRGDEVWRFSKGKMIKIPPYNPKK